MNEGPKGLRSGKARIVKMTEVQNTPAIKELREVIVFGVGCFDIYNCEAQYGSTFTNSYDDFLMGQTDFTFAGDQFGGFGPPSPFDDPFGDPSMNIFDEIEYELECPPGSNDLGDCTTRVKAKKTK